jgi:hypothetical protein
VFDVFCCALLLFFGAGLDYLISKFYSPNYGISYRQNILLVVQQTAQTLSSLVVVSEEAENLITQGRRKEDFLLPLQFPCGTVVKRFTKNKKANSSENRFGAVASRCFYPLAAKYDATTNQLDMLGRGEQCWWLLLVVVGCWWLLLVVVGCWLLVVVGCCWLLLVVVGLFYLLLFVVVYLLVVVWLVG